MVPQTLVVGRDAPHVLIRRSDVRVGLQVGVRVVAHHMLLPPQEGGHPNLQARCPSLPFPTCMLLVSLLPHLYIGAFWLSDLLPAFMGRTAQLARRTYLLA